MDEEWVSIPTNRPLTRAEADVVEEYAPPGRYNCRVTGLVVGDDGFVSSFSGHIDAIDGAFDSGPVPSGIEPKDCRVGSTITVTLGWGK